MLFSHDFVIVVAHELGSVEDHALNHLTFRIHLSFLICRIVLLLVFVVFFFVLLLHFFRSANDRLVPGLIERTLEVNSVISSVKWIELKIFLAHYINWLPMIFLIL